MASIALKLFVLTVILAVVSASPLERKRRVFGLKTALNKIKGAAGAVGGGIKKAGGAVGKGIKVSAGAVGKGIKVSAGAVGGGIKGAAGAIGSGIKGAAVGIGGGVTGSIKWMFNIKPKAAKTVEKEAEIILTETDTTIHKGNELVIKGENLLKKADELEKSLGSSVDKRDDDQDDPQGVRGIIRALREAAERSITIGKKIVDNSERIAAALKDAVVDISAVVSEGMVDVGGAFAEVSESVAKAGVVLAKAKAFTDDLNTGVEDAATQLETASELVVEAARSFEEVGIRSLNLVQRVFALGKNLFKVIGSAAMNIVKATGITGKK
ncbi:hypothetical protein RRG08_040837 [Elysia crispata]|uniref:Uncharacterized protein n=1 Tax=Elysia crispata TaxID=231223 RepID=A0AAE1DC62_9GAST|nr:hypothetical protein RRG08_040837 [Elysia crispata]